MPEYDYRILDDVIHSRVRLAIMAYLATADTADFTELKTRLNLSDGNLSTHLKKLEDTGYVTVNKGFSGRKPLTTVSLSDDGKKAFKNYIEGLAAMLGPDLK